MARSEWSDEFGDAREHLRRRLVVVDLRPVADLAVADRQRTLDDVAAAFEAESW
jgi:hypothetical protein